MKMNVVDLDKLIQDEREKEMGVEKVEMDELMEREDLIKIKKKIIEKKRNIINEKKMEKMKKGVRIVN